MMKEKLSAEQRCLVILQRPSDNLPRRLFVYLLFERKRKAGQPNKLNNRNGSGFSVHGSPKFTKISARKAY
jgi:hypothetical protein